MDTNVALMIALLHEVIAGQQKIEEKVDALIENLGEFADQVEESVVRVEDAARTVLD